MSKTPLALLVAAIGLSGGAAFAANTITFHGEVTASTCKVSINNQDNAVVLLPTVPASELDAAGKKAGLTTLTLQLSECEAPQNDRDLVVKMVGHGVTAGGHLDNIAANGAQNVALQLSAKEDGSDEISLANGPVQAAKLTLKQGEKEASHTFAVQYVAEGGAAGNGPVKGVVDYVISYL